MVMQFGKYVYLRNYTELKIVFSIMIMCSIIKPMTSMDNKLIYTYENVWNFIAPVL